MHTIRSTPPLSSSFNHSPCLFHDTLLPKCSCSCSYSCSCSCCCYAANISVHDRLTTVNPRFLQKGLSQPTLIQSSLSKRFIFQERRYQRFRGFVQKKKGHILSNVVVDCVNDGEVMLSLLTDEVGLECTDVKNRKKISKEKKSVGLGVVKMKSLKESEDLDLRKEGSFGELEGNKDFEVKSGCYCVGQTSSSAYKNDSRKDCISGVVKMKYLKESENLDLGKEGNFGESEGNKDFEVKSDCYCVGQTSSSAYKNDSRKDCIDGVVKMKYLKESENLDLRKEGSFGESEGDKDFEVKSDCYCVGQTSEYKNDLRKDCNGRIDKVVKMKSLQESENLDFRKEGSFGESEGSKDIEVKSDCYYVGQTSLVEYKKDLRKDGKGCNDGVVGKIERRQESVQEPEGLLEKDNVNGCYGVSVGASQRESNVSSDWRKKSEKKLNKELSQHVSNASANIEPCCRIHSNEIFNLTDETGSRMKYKRFADTSNNGNSVVESTFTTENKLKVIPEAMVSKPTSTEDNKDDGSGTCGQKDGGSRHSSQGSGPKGPSDEMWHVTDASTQEPSEPDNTVQTSGSSENGEPVKTSNRSLWTVIGDMVRLQWKPSRSGSQSHTPTSGGAKGSSYFSTSSETWFSSREPYDSNDEDVKRSIIKGLDSSLPEGPSRKTCLPMIKESSFSLKRSPKIKNMVKQDPDQLTELKRRKLVHKDQVFKDDFDKWEETYNLENKQHKEDEMFMREALVEAKKAADVWEVPVGAVLVKDGKIIARGYNMVEQLQDSTAHAEMICIRKASTVSSSWRLSDTTLYVTLEPCPMCAGAILQARIHTVVWGAPNKLLGADGSWVRLFCDSDGGSSSMPPDMPCAPPHPFHPNMTVRRGVLAAECAEVMQQFFRLRRKKKAEPEPEPPNLRSSISVSHHHQHHHSNFLSKLHHAFKVIFCL
ncbi:putative tRNA(adenine(34)) deaminase [Helianthus debilis subsp. tardiflorus]